MIKLVSCTCLIILTTAFPLIAESITPNVGHMPNAVLSGRTGIIIRGPIAFPTRIGAPGNVEPIVTARPIDDEATPTPTPTPTRTATPTVTPTPIAPPLTGELAQALGRHGIEFGLTVNSSKLTSPNPDAEAYRNVVLSEAMVIGAENDLKPKAIMRAGVAFDPMSAASIEAATDFTKADIVANFARAHGLKMHGHTLLWHQSRPEGLEQWTSAQAESFIRKYIALVVGRYKDVITTWDVVNEVWTSSGYRASAWYEKLGSNMMRIAFEAARAADPLAKLYWNEFLDSDGACAEAKRLKLAGVQIDGLGWQNHLSIETDQNHTGTLSVAFAQCVANAGLDLAVTEYDAPIKLPITSQKIALQARVAKDTVLNCINGAGARCVAFRTWGVYDGQSWRNEPGVYEQPLFFDVNLLPKVVYFAVEEAL